MAYLEHFCGNSEGGTRIPTMGNPLGHCHLSTGAVAAARLRKAHFCHVAHVNAAPRKRAQQPSEVVFPASAKIGVFNCCFWSRALLQGP